MQEEISIFPEQEVIYAGFWQRFAASFIDGLILLVPLFIINYIFTGSLTVIFTFTSVPGLINIAIWWLYTALQESSQIQATVGKRAMNIIVTDLQGGRISFGRATGRLFGKYVSAIILLIGYLMMLWNPKRQALHDMMAGTLVLSNSSGMPSF